ncbi:centrosomal protein kizuna-like isoform X2 [Gigantopelta aegis]|uniref:centrosomal protein kizuna-like isoform X2 n=1 Tax=Gigantopelta aegis TaxID=1735272 RepID=UPI001B8896EC|nr:centrosomal protein kizuna-like isoform X2 [Gigantopelta aegis]
MATSNVEYYERQKELQDTLHQSEQERRQIDLQLKTYFQSDQHLAKLKAVKLHTYWKKICDQEKRSKERNEQILRNFERTDAHIASLSARTEKLRFLKQQYEEEIERKYPQWRELVRRKHEGETQKQAESNQKKDEHVKAENQKIKVTKLSEHRIQSVNTNVSAIPSSNIFNIRATTVTPVISKTPMSSTPASRQAAAAVTSNVTSQQARVSKDETKLVEVTAPMSMLVQSSSKQNVSTQDEPKRLVGKENQQPKAAAPVANVGSMNPLDDDDKLSDFGYDIDLPIGDTNQPLQGSRDAEHSRAESVQHFSRASSLQSSRKASDFGDLKPELTLDGLLYILKFVQNDFNEAFNVDGFYRSSRPDSKQKMEIIRMANHGEELNLIDADLISMVALDEMTLVIRNLTEGCLLPDGLLETNTTKQTAESIKSQLSPDAQTLWMGLFEHFDQIIKHKVMEPKEIACIFVPCLVENGSPNQDKALSLLVRLLTGVDADGTDEATPVASPRIAATPRLAATPTYTDDGKVPPLKFGSLIDSQRTVTDEDTSMFSNTASKEKIPLNETDAYKNMLSGTVTQNRDHDDDDTDDDIEKQFHSALTPREPESEKREVGSTSQRQPPISKAAVIEDEDVSSVSLPSAAGSPVYVPTTMTGFRSTMTSTGSNQTPRKPMGIKISSDVLHYVICLPCSGNQDRF